jgi:uncharacterized protein
MDLLPNIIQLANADNEISILWLYGSRANQTEQAHSDYDLAIAFNLYLKDPLENSLRPEKLRLEWCQQLQCDENLISIVDINIIPIHLAWEVVTKSKVLICKDESRLYHEESRVFSQYELDLMYHREKFGE